MDTCGSVASQLEMETQHGDSPETHVQKEIETLIMENR
jgi:hypothetical protein